MIEKYFKAILDNSPECIVLIDKDHRILAFNQTVSEVLYLYHNKKIKVGEYYFPDYVIESHRELYLEAFHSAINGKTFNVQNLTSSEHASFWFEYKMSPVYDGQDMLGVTLSAKNITQEKEAELKIIDISNKLRAILDNTDESITLLDLDYKILAINAVALQNIIENTNIDYDNLIGSDFRHFIPDTNNLFYKYYPKAAKGQPSHVEISYQNAHGDIIWYQTAFHPVFNNQNEQIGVSIFARNITQTKKLQQSLQESEEKFSTISKILPIGLIITNREFKVEYTNIAAKRMLGYPHTDWDNKYLYEIIENFKLNQNNQLQIETLNAQIKHPIFDQEKLTAITYNGKKIDVLLSSIYFISNNKPQYTFVIQDISSINKKDHLISEQRSKLRDISWYQSHIVRAPLARILGLTHLLQDELTNNTEEISFILQALLDSSNELDQVIHKITQKT